MSLQCSPDPLARFRKNGMEKRETWKGKGREKTEEEAGTWEVNATLARGV